MKKKLISLGLILGVLVSFSGCSTKDLEDNNGERLRVGVTINPLKDFAEAIGGDKVEVFSIIPDGSDAHSFDPKPRDSEKLINADIFIYNGLQMEEWIDSVLGIIEGKDVKVLESSDGVKEINISEEDNHENEGEDEHDHESEEEHEHDHNHGGVDPHVWLSLNNAIIQAENIKNVFSEIDPENKDYYETNFEKLKSDFTSLYNEYKDKFKDLENKNFVTGHAAFGYLCKDFGLTQKSITGIFDDDGEVKPKDFEELVNYSKENGVKVIFNESTSSSSNADTLAKSVGAKVVKVYSLETKEDNMSYIEGMRYNLETIYNSLK